MKSRSILIKTILAAILFSLALSPVLAEDTINMIVSQDCAIQSANPDTNYNGDQMVLTQYQKAYIQFDASMYSGTVLSIDNLEFNATPQYARDADAYLLTGDGVDDWDQTTITWNNAPGNDTASGSEFLNDATYTATFLGKTEQGTGGVETVGFIWDAATADAVKAAIINELNTGDRKVTIGLSRNSSSRYARYASLENMPTYHPIRMDVTFDSAELIGNYMMAEPDSREVYFMGQIVNPGEVEPLDRARAGFTQDPYFDGNLVLAFKLPEIPAGEVISMATFNFFYITRYSGRTYPNNHLYALPYKPAAEAPVTVDDFYVGSNDSSNLMLAANIFSDDKQGQWINTNPDSKILAAFIQEQINNGAVAGDWIRLRFSPTQMMNVYQNHQIYGPTADENLKPFIEFDTAPASEGYWKMLELEGQHSILETGVVTSDALGYIGASDSQTRALLYPFAFPELASNEYVSDVFFGAQMSNPYMFPGRYFDIDLYGLPYRSSADFAATDYWLGAYSVLPEEGLNGTPIASSITEDLIASQPAWWQLDEDGSLRAACYLNAQKAAGATSSSYGFFRLNARYNHLYYTRQMINNPEILVKVSTTAPTCPTEAPDTEYACPFIGYTDYPAGDIDNDCMVTLSDVQAMVADWLTCNAEPASYYCP